MHEVLTVAQMYEADRAAMAAGIPGTVLMEQAGRAVARAVMARWGRRPVSILCGPGNNGGDGFIAARHLAGAGWPVRLALLGERAALTGDAAWAAGTWTGPVEPPGPALLEGAGVLVDALFGAGLNRPPDGIAAGLIRMINDRDLPVVAVDVPSGLRGDDGGTDGPVMRATVTVSFFRPKPAHLLYPGRGLCGRLVLADIGIPDAVLPGLHVRLWRNHPDLWLGLFPRPHPSGHKYQRGHAVIAGGPVMTGAGRLAATAARRLGAGLLTIAAPRGTEALYALAGAGVIVQPVDQDADFARLLDDSRHNAVLLGPGAGVSDSLCRRVRMAVDRGKAGVLDADVFRAFQGHAPMLFQGLSDRWLLTPHDGEFARLFADLAGSRLDRARQAAARCGAVILLKGPDTVIAHPDGRAVINAEAPPELATAGSGDVLAGMALGLIAQGMPAFEAGCAAAWLHGQVARRFGPGLIAEDIAGEIPALLRDLPRF